MEISLYNSNGVAVAYIADDRENTIYTWNGNAVAYILGATVYGWCGLHLGWFINGVICDRRGHQVGFLRQRCPVVVRGEYAKPPKNAKYAKYERGVASARPPITTIISKQLLEDFIAQDAP